VRLEIADDVDLSVGWKLSKYIANAFRMPIPVNQVGVGANAFAHESGIHADGALKDHRNYEIYDYEEVGRGEFEKVPTGRIITTGEYGGIAGFRYVYKEYLGIEFKDTAQAQRVPAFPLSTVRDLSEDPQLRARLARAAGGEHIDQVSRPYERDGRRFVDGMALVPVPTGAVMDDGADVTVAVNLLSGNTLDRWPGEALPPPLSESRRRPGMLDTLLEVMDLSQLDDSVRLDQLALQEPTLDHHLAIGADVFVQDAGGRGDVLAGEDYGDRATQLGLQLAVAGRLGGTPGQGVLDHHHLDAPVTKLRPQV